MKFNPFAYFGAPEITEIDHESEPHPAIRRIFQTDGRKLKSKVDRILEDY